jgi:ElaB/YqjD/DUF883 family membrane-anchored ribosome-binding protein
MDHDRESRGTGSGVGGTGFGSTGTGAGGAFGDAGRPIDETAAGTGAYDRTVREHDEKSLKEQVGDKLEEGREAVGERLEEGRERASHALDTGRNRIADQLDRVGDRIHERARDMEDSGGVQRRAGQVAHRAGDALDSSAEYLRSHDFDEMRGDFEHAIRERPLFSVGIALGAGFLLARILRD